MLIFLVNSPLLSFDLFSVCAVIFLGISNGMILIIVSRYVLKALDLDYNDTFIEHADR